MKELTSLFQTLTKNALQDVSRKYGATIYRGDDIYNEEMDIYAPCALGATINDETVYKLKS